MCCAKGKFYDYNLSFQSYTDINSNCDLACESETALIVQGPGRVSRSAPFSGRGRLAAGLRLNPRHLYRLQKAPRRTELRTQEHRVADVMLRMRLLVI
eukprot:6206311-Pleurochrysis_carterae.AAC.2